MAAQTAAGQPRAASSRLPRSPVHLPRQLAAAPHQPRFSPGLPGDAVLFPGRGAAFAAAHPHPLPLFHPQSATVFVVWNAGILARPPATTTRNTPSLAGAITPRHRQRSRSAGLRRRRLAVVRPHAAPNHTGPPLAARSSPAQPGRRRRALLVAHHRRHAPPAPAAAAHPAHRLHRHWRAAHQNQRPFLPVYRAYRVQLPYARPSLAHHHAVGELPPGRRSHLDGRRRHVHVCRRLATESMVRHRGKEAVAAKSGLGYAGGDVGAGD